MLPVLGRSLHEALGAGLEEVLSRGPGVTELVLRRCHVPIEAIAGVARALSGGCQLSVLDVAESDFGDEHASLIAEALRNKCALTTLRVGASLVTDAGAALMLRAARRNGRLVVFDATGAWRGQRRQTDPWVVTCASVRVCARLPRAQGVASRQRSRTTWRLGISALIWS